MATSTSKLDIRLYQVRFPRELWQRIEQEAEVSGESLNAVVVRWCQVGAGQSGTRPKARRS